MARFDNMGGIVAADFVLQDDIAFFAPFADECTVSLKSNRYWKPLDMKSEGFSLTISSKNEESGLKYTIKGSVILKKECENLNLLRLSPLILIRYQTVDRKYRVIGTDEFLLESTLRPLTPSKPSGFAGYEISFEGKQLIEPPFLNI